MDAAELERLREIRDRYCVPRKCDCIRECYRVWNRWWHEKAVVCTHPGWAKVKDVKPKKEMPMPMTTPPQQLPK